MEFKIYQYRHLIFSLVILIFSFSILAYLIFAWSPPTQSPPQGNVPPPINVGPTDQIKSGGLGAKTLVISYGAVLSYLGGNVGIGTTRPTYKLHVQAGDIFASGYVRGQTGLCIGSDCRTSWPTGGGESYWAASGNNIYNTNSGNVGIGTTAPSQKLDVAGYVKGTGLCIGSDCRTSWPSGGGEITTTIVSVQAPCDWIGTAWCPSGYKVLGGGIGYTGERTCNGGEHKIYWVASYPVVQGSNQGWACGADDYNPYCYAICGK